MEPLKKPLEHPPEVPDGDDTVAGGGTPRMVETSEKDLADAPELDEDDIDEDEAEDPHDVADL